MEITNQQKEALSELVNIGFSRAAEALSRLLNQRIRIFAPQIQILTLEEFGQALPGQIDSEVASVNQVFEGPLTGTAMLMLEYDSSAVLVDLLTGGDGRPRRLTASDREALVEVGNILLNAYLGTFGNLLNVHIAFNVPRLTVSAVESLLSSFTISGKAMEYAITVRTEFQLTQGEVGGFVILVMGVESLDALISGLDEAEFMQ